MVKIDILIREEKVSRIRETELQRYIEFFKASYQDNLEHAEANLASHPRWSIISGYYAMHDVTKLFLAKEFKIKIDLKVHKTAIQLLQEITSDKELLKLLQTGYEEFIKLANDLAEGKEERMKAQYYTGTAFMKDKYKEEANSFLIKTVMPYIEKIKKPILK